VGVGCRRHRRSGDERKGHIAQLGGVFAAEGELLHLLLHGRVGLLSAGEVAGRKAGPELIEVLEQRIHAAGAGAFAPASTFAPATHVVVMTEVAGGKVALGILLDGGVIFLRGGQVARLEIAAELGEGLRDRVGRGGRGSGGAGGRTRGGRGLRKGGLQGGEIGLGRRQIAGLNRLPELLQFLLQDVAGGGLVLSGTAAENPGNRH